MLGENYYSGGERNLMVGDNYYSGGWIILTVGDNCWRNKSEFASKEVD